MGWECEMEMEGLRERVREIGKLIKGRDKGEREKKAEVGARGG